MTYSNNAAFSRAACGLVGEDYDQGDAGITVREYFAAAALQGLMANPLLGQLGPGEAAKSAVDQADLLIAALNEVQP